MTASLKQQAEDFANELTRTVRAVVGEDCHAFFALAVQDSDAFRVRQEPSGGIILSDKRAPILRLAADYICIYDGHHQYMAIEKSKIHVFKEPGGREPLFRYEFERRVTGKIPGAHIQFHGRHPELESAMAECGDSTGRAKARKAGRKQVQLDSLHFPVGGPRFRPALEDVLEMLIEEFGVQPVGSVRAARRALADAREGWRRKQIATVVRDAPSEAAEALRELDYTVDPPKPAPRDKQGKLRAI